MRSSPLSKLQGVPKLVSLDDITQDPDKSTFNNGSQTLAVLLEGNFTSVYNNRIKPFDLSNVKNESVPTQMIVISDGDVIKNDVLRNQPQNLGFDRASSQPIGNKEFLINAVNYLLQDDKLLDIRTKEVAIAF